MKNPEKATLAVFTDEDIKRTESIFAQEIKDFADIYAFLNDTAIKVMGDHAPEHVKEQIGYVIGNSIFFRTVGFLGGCALDTGIITIPDGDNAASMYAYRIGENVSTGDVM